MPAFRTEPRTAMPTPSELIDEKIDGLADCDTATLAAWILAQARAVLPMVDRVDLYETRGCGAIVIADRAEAQAGLAIPI